MLAEVRRALTFSKIWRLTRGASQTATVFVEMQPIGAINCQWRTQVIGTT